MSAMEIRPELPSDAGAIYSVPEQAFRDMPYAGGDEPEVVDRLRAADALSLSLVACIGDEVVGHIAFSPAEQADGSAPWFALGPVSVVPEFQGQGIGGAMIEQGIAELTQRGALGCILTGNPKYYTRFGFELSPKHVPQGEPEQYFMLKMLSSTPPSGRFSFHGAFYG